MASLELILSEREWQNLLSLSMREYAKQLFQVDISRKDEFGASSSDGGPSSPPLLQMQQQGNKKSTDKYDSGIGIVPISLQTTENILSDEEEYILRPPPVIVHVQTDSSPSNLEKCRKLAIACCPANPDFKFIKIKLENQKSLEMVKAWLPSIRQSTATLINCYPESSDITVQGHQSGVDLAQHHIDMILQDFKPNSSHKKSQYAVISNHSPSALIEAKNSSCVKNSSSVDAQFHHDLLSDSPSSQVANSNIPSPAKSDDSVFFSGDHGNHYEDRYNFTALSNLVNKECEYDIPAHSDTATSACPPFQAYTKSCDGNIERDSSSDSEPDNILADDRFSKHIDQARKLGFSDEQILKVLRRLGVNSSIDAMMRELVLDPLALDQDDGMKRLEDSDNDEINLSSKGEDSDDSEGFDVNDSSNLRHIIIDGSNVAMSHGQKVFSCLGIKIVVDWFKSRGHKNITAFVPQWRKEASRPDAPITNQEILAELEAERIVVFTPSRRIGGTRIVCYDDRYVLQLAVQKDGIVVSNDVYRDLVRESDDFKEVVEKRLLMYSFVQDMFMPPEDPLGRQGPSLDNFLRIKPSEPKNKPQICPYGKKCTYGNKCRFYHPERRYASQKMVAEKLKESAELKLKSFKAEKSAEAATEKGKRPKQKLVRTVSLVPQNVTDDAKSHVIPVQTKKPPLHHSKSMVYTSSYLNDLRLKMEEAESAETLKQYSLHHQEVNADQTCAPAKKQHSISCNPSPRTSPTPETSKTNLKAVRSFPCSPVPNLPPSFPVSNINSSLDIPNPVPQDRYLSGHLLVVKKLSDEDNSNGNFFSQHKSRAPGSSQGNETSAFNGHLSSDSNQSIVSPVIQVSTSKPLIDKEIQDSNLWNGQEIYRPPDITTQVDYNTLTRKSSLPISPTNSFVPKERKHIPSSTHAPVVPISEQYDSCPTFSQKDAYDLPERQNFRRSLSSNTPPSLEYCNPHRHSPRKHSLNTISAPKPNSNVPLNQRVSCSQYNSAPPFQPQFQRGRMSLDSGISSGGLSADQTLNSPFSPTENCISPFSYPTSMSSPVIYSPTTNNPTRFMMTQQETMYNSSLSGISSPSAPFQYSPLPNRMPPPFQDHCRTQSHVPLSNSVHQTQHPPIFHPPPPYSTMTQYMSCPPPSQPPLQPTYPQGMTNTESRFYPMPLHGAGDSPLPYSPNTPLSPFFQQSPSIQPQSKMVDAEAAISVEDPRYSIYYNLSSVFGERAVRTFMNRNPDVRNINELYSLIASYKQDTGL